MISEFWVEITADEYIWDAFGDEQVCLLLILPNSYDFYILGIPIL